MIAATTEIQTLLGLGSTDYNGRIDLLRPIVQDDLVEICNNTFFLRNVYVRHTGISFTTSTGDGDKVHDSEEQFLDTVDDSKFVASRDVVIYGSQHNDGHYELSSVSSGALTLATSGEVVTGSTGEIVTVAQVKWPRGLKPIYSQMIWHRIDNAQGGLAQSESIDDYSVTYAEKQHGYPKETIDALKSGGYLKARMQ